MSIDISRIKGLVFRHPSSGDEYGTIRKPGYAPYPDYFADSPLTPFADDDCGNIFAVGAGGEIVWWNHETEDITVLASSFEEFCTHCSELGEVELKEGQVKSVWMDPELAKQLGIECPPDGWIKKANPNQ